MNALKVLIDTNVLIDFLTDRGSLIKTAKEIVKIFRIEPNGSGN